MKGNRVACPLCGCTSLPQAGLPGHVSGARCDQAVAGMHAAGVALTPEQAAVRRAVSALEQAISLALRARRVAR